MLTGWLEAAFYLLASSYVQHTACDRSADPDMNASNAGASPGYDAGNEGVVTLPSGVQYEVLLAGSGEPPQAGDSVLISYEARLPDGTVFDTTYDVGPLQMSLDDIVVPGLKKALPLMNTGSRWHVVIPANRGFSTGNRMFRRHDLIYDIELVSIDRAQPGEAGY